MKANEKIKIALATASRKHGSYKLAAICGLVGNYPGLVIRGEKKGFGWEKWEKVWPILVKEGGLDPNDPECLPLSMRKPIPPAETLLSPKALALATQWMKLKPRQQKQVLALMASLSCIGKGE